METSFQYILDDVYETAWQGGAPALLFVEDVQYLIQKSVLQEFIYQGEWKWIFLMKHIHSRHDSINALMHTVFFSVHL